MSVQEFFIKATEFGPFAALCFALIYYMRKDHRQDYIGVSKRLNEVEDYQKTKLTDLVEHNARVVEKNTSTMEQHTEAINRVVETVANCQSFKDQ